MKLALNSATFIKLSTWLSDFVLASVHCSFANDRWRFFLFVTTKFTLHFFNWYFPSRKFTLCGSSSFPDWNARIVLYMPWYIQTFQLPLQSQWYTRPSGFLTQSFDQSETSEVNHIRRSIFFPFLFSFLYVYEMLARPTLGLFSIENVLNLHAPLHCTAVHNFRQKRVFIICPIQMISYTKLYDILRISGWQEAYPQLENAVMAWACKVKNFATAGPWSMSWRHGPEFRSHSNCRHFQTYVPNWID